MTTADPDKTRDVYEKNAAGYDRNRARAFFEARWLSRFADSIPHGANVLDLGCGAGEPIAAWLIGEGFQLTGVDFSKAMLEIAKQRWPNGDWRKGDMRSLDLDARFQGIIAWNSFFHLTKDEQRACLPRLARHLEPNGILMVTVGHKDGVVTGTVEGEAVFHASLSASEYAARLEENGLRMTAYMAEDPWCDYHSVLMARKD
ncbi:MAG: class I SAM-dependent methyltransferase [Boseongicola sp.]